MIIGYLDPWGKCHVGYSWGVYRFLGFRVMGLLWSLSGVVLRSLIWGGMGIHIGPRPSE